MITFDEAYKKVVSHTLDLGTEKVALLQSVGRILAEDILADRDFPPFDRATKDGIALSFSAIEKGQMTFNVEGVCSAGMSQQTLKSSDNCLEIMTGAVLPKNTDTVIMYEDITLIDGKALLSKTPKKGQNIHQKGSDDEKGSLLIKKGKRISAAEVGILASVGKTAVLVKNNPKVCVISTGNELVEISETPLPHQIRKSNTLSLTAALFKEGILPQQLHLDDDKVTIEKGLRTALNENDVLLLSGGVSKGKFDFIPEVMEALGVQKVFHRVAQRPGKPFWFGIHPTSKTVIFSFPGNPVSTFANYHVYFLPWLDKSLELPIENRLVILEDEIKIPPPLTRFIQVKTQKKEAGLFASFVMENGSGDLISLSKADGFICLPPKEESYRKGDLVLFIPAR